MSYLALYRRYRPTNFDNLIGQDHIVKTLKNQIESEMIGHAYLFTGTRGTGKTSAAKIFAKAINCENPINGSPCGKCSICKSLEDPSNIDIVEIDAASNNGVNEIRELRENVQYPPVTAKYKVYIIDEVHMLTGAAFNALLKTLEEPPKHAVFILATTEVYKIPATILSRCMRFDFKLIETEVIAKKIASIYDEVGKVYDLEAVTAIAKAGEGSMRDALSIADIALSYGKGKLTYDDVVSVLGSSSNETLFEFTKNVILGNTGKVLENIDKMCSLGKNVGVIVKDFILLIRDLLVIKTCNNPNKILVIPDNKFIELKQIADLTTEERLLRILSVFSEIETSLKFTTNPRVVFETAAVKSAKPESDYSIDALLSRISELENKINKGSIKIDNVVEKIPEEKIEIPKTPTDLKGKLLFNLRKDGSEMLFNVVQNVSVTLNGNLLTITVNSEGDKSLLDMPNSIESIKTALKDIDGLKIEVVLSDENKKKDELDSEAEKLKKIFGDDIVIIK